VLGGHTEDGLLDRLELAGEIRHPQALVLHLAEGVVDQDHHLIPKASLDVGARGSPERADELRDEDVRGSEPPAIASVDPQAHEAEVGVAEDVWVGAAELAIEDSLLEVVDFGLLPNAGERLDQPTDNRGVEARQRVPVRPVEVRKDLTVPEEYRDLVLSDDDVVVEADVAGHPPHDVGALVGILPVDRRRAEQAPALLRYRLVGDHALSSSSRPGFPLRPASVPRTRNLVG
jgi:hypothetical protein